MNVGNLVKTVTSFTRTNSPILTTVVGASGVVAVAVLAAKAGAKAQKNIGFVQSVNIKNGHPPFTAKQYVASTWRYYIPTAAAASITIGAIVTGHRVNASRTAAATAAFAVSERAFDEYRRRIVERLGVDDERKIRNEVRETEKKREEHSPVMVFGGGTVTCLDMFSGRYFACDMNTLRKAENEVNSIVWQQMYCSLSEFYDFVGLPKTGNSDYVGWNTDHSLELSYGTTLAPDDTPCLTFNFVLNPKPQFADFGN